MGVFNVNIFLMESHCWGSFLPKSRLLFEKGCRSPGLDCPRPHRELSVCWEPRKSVSKIHLVFDFLDGLPGCQLTSSRCNIKKSYTYYQKLVERLKSCKSSSNSVSYPHHQWFGVVSLTPTIGTGYFASPQLPASIDQQ